MKTMNVDLKRMKCFSINQKILKIKKKKVRKRRVKKKMMDTKNHKNMTKTYAPARNILIGTHITKRVFSIWMHGDTDGTWSF